VFVSILQQFSNIKYLTDFQVEEYYGAKGVDTWTLKTWEQEISNNDVCYLLTPYWFHTDTLGFIYLLTHNWFHKDTLGFICCVVIDLSSIILGLMTFSFCSLIIFMQLVLITYVTSLTHEIYSGLWESIGDMIWLH